MADAILYGQNATGAMKLKEANGTFAHPGTSEIEVSLGFKPLAVFTQRNTGSFLGGLICNSNGEMVKYWTNTGEQQSAATTNGMRISESSFFFTGRYTSVAGNTITWYAIGV